MDFLEDVANSSTATTTTEPPKSSSTGVFGINIKYFHDFIQSHNISETMLTSEVVETIIIPETISTKQTYLAAKLKDGEYHEFDNNQPSLLSDVPYERLRMFRWRKNKIPKAYFFVSHCWKMPFKELFESILRQCRRFYIDEYWEPFLEDLDGVVFLWIDVFCKNQHIPAPAMEEFHHAVHCSQGIIAPMWPHKNPIPLGRVWCLYELYTAIRQEKMLIFDASIQVESPVDVRNATATFLADVNMIMSLIERHIGFEQVNEMIQNHIENAIALHHQSVNNHPGSFDAFGMYARE